MAKRDDGPITSWDGDRLRVGWDERLCIHVGECTRAGDGVFESGRDPWCRPDAAERTRVLEIVERCPTGALSAHDPAGGAIESEPPPNQVLVASDGPLYVRGQLTVDGAGDDMPSTRRRVALCRCGASSRKPFCDNSHRAAGFRDAGAVGERGDRDEDALVNDGPLEIERAANGPLLLRGRFELVSGNGRVAWRGSKAALCRCGRSKNKPFCDGSHKAAGFEAD